MGPKISNNESYYSGSQQCGGYFSLDNYLVKLMSDQRHALFKKMVHRPRASRPSCGNIKRFIKSRLFFSIASSTLVTEVLRSCIFLIRCL